MNGKQDAECSRTETGDTQHICKNFHSTIEFIGKRWMGIVIYTLLGGPKRFYEMQDSIPGISDRLLTERLRDLEKEGLVVKRISKSAPRKVEYELTPAGKDLECVIHSLRDWIRNREKER